MSLDIINDKDLRDLIISGKRKNYSCSNDDLLIFRVGNGEISNYMLYNQLEDDFNLQIEHYIIYDEKVLFNALQRANLAIKMCDFDFVNSSDYRLKSYLGDSIYIDKEGKVIDFDQINDYFEDFNDDFSSSVELLRIYGQRFNGNYFEMESFNNSYFDYETGNLIISDDMPEIFYDILLKFAIEKNLSFIKKRSLSDEFIISVLLESDLKDCRKKAYNYFKEDKLNEIISSTLVGLKLSIHKDKSLKEFKRILNGIFLLQNKHSTEDHLLELMGLFIEMDYSSSLYEMEEDSVFQVLLVLANSDYSNQEIEDILSVVSDLGKETIEPLLSKINNENDLTTALKKLYDRDVNINLLTKKSDKVHPNFKRFLLNVDNKEEDLSLDSELSL